MSSSTGASSAPKTVEGSVLWQFVTKLDKFGGKGENFKWKCNYCGVTKNDSYTRVKAHLLKVTGEGVAACEVVTSPKVAKFHKLIEEEKAKAEQSQPKKVPLPPSSASLTSTSFNETQGGLGSKKRRANTSESDNPVIKAFNVGARDHLHNEIARMFYSGGLPFNLARNPHYVSSYMYAANHSIPGYIPPGYNLLRTRLLQRERANIERLLDPIKGTWKEKGLTIASDGWSDSQRRSLINFMAVTGGAPMFLKAVNCEGEIKDKHFIASLMKETMLQIVKVAGQIIEAQYPHIFWTPCVVHTLNLALKNICAAKNIENNSLVYDECSWITIVVGDASCIKNFIMNHSMRLAIFNEFVSLKLLSVAETRFASSIVMLRRFKLIKQGLQSMVISTQWNSHREEQGASFVRETLLNEKWWDKVDYILSFTAPIYDMLRECDTDKPTLHLIYDMWDNMIEKVKCVIYKHEEKHLEDESEFYDVVHKILVDRYYSDIWLEEDPKRVPPHKDEEVTNERKKCLKRYLNDSTERTKANMEYAKFSTKEGSFSDVDSIEDRYNMDPHSWWVIHGASAPILQTLALKILTQPSSSSCCERNWSTYSFIHSLRRNKMTPQRAEDLVYIHSNLRLLSRRSPQYCNGVTKMWDIAGDQFGSLDDVGMLEVANLSLDEPEMEVVVFTDDGDGDQANSDEEVIEVGSN
ncbi:uncharacterized protein LOC131298593 [Rhododendron vialii]|uniref:uncharacterized protein LOC131298593 n=1 Tax=Rhododendron vialii TaxID=182163 RepID=UPI00265E8292|nr:uncharacterized protein LOC131298593 [Rhododendron vialii]